MKLSSRKQLLHEADEILLEIQRHVKRKKVNEIDWEKHKAWARGEWSPLIQFNPEAPEIYSDKMKNRGMRAIEKKYTELPPNSYTPEQKNAEIDQLLADVQKLRDHLGQKREEIPMDPKKQTELQRYIVNHPIVTPEELKRNPDSVIYKDPKTGLLWNLNFGAPVPANELIRFDKHEMENVKRIVNQMVKEKSKQEYPGLAEWDHSRGFFWNLFRILLNLPGTGAG